MIYEVNSMTVKGNYKNKPDYEGSDIGKAIEVYTKCTKKSPGVALTSHEGIYWKQLYRHGQWPEEHCI